MGDIGEHDSFLNDPKPLGGLNLGNDDLASGLPALVGSTPFLIDKKVTVITTANPEGENPSLIGTLRVEDVEVALEATKDAPLYSLTKSLMPKFVTGSSPVKKINVFDPATGEDVEAVEVTVKPHKADEFKDWAHYLTQRPAPSSEYWQRVLKARQAEKSLRELAKATAIGASVLSLLPDRILYIEPLYDQKNNS